MKLKWIITFYELRFRLNGNYYQLVTSDKFWKNLLVFDMNLDSIKSLEINHTNFPEFYIDRKNTWITFNNFIGSDPN